MGILRTTVFLASALALLPSPPEDSNAATVAAQEQAVQASYLVAATSIISDLTSFCDRQPAACETAGILAARLERNAKYSVKLLYEWANSPAEDESDKPLAKTAVLVDSDQLITGSTDSDASPSQSTLKIDDLLPPWIGPAPKKG